MQSTKACVVQCSSVEFGLGEVKYLSESVEAIYVFHIIDNS